MGRAPRLQIPGGLHHITTRGNRRQNIYVNELDPSLFTHLLTRIVCALGWRCHSFCLMPNHYHLVIETPEPNLSIGMQRLNGVYAKWFNAAHDLEGHLFERRFRSIVIESQAHLVELSRYLALNPVRAGLCRHPSEWPWSSYGAMIGTAQRPDFLTCDWLLSQFGANLDGARASFVAFVDGFLVTE